MIRTITLAAILCSSILSLQAQTTIVLQPGPADGKDAEIFSCVPCGYNNHNYGTKRDFNAIAWTKNGNTSLVRSLIEFDLSQIPQSAIIHSATLSLYFNPTSEEGSHAQYLGCNDSYIQRITSPWSESTVTWDNQPTTTPLNRISLPPTTYSSQSFTNINVKKLILDSRRFSTSSFGFMLSLQNECVFKKLIFASSDNPNPAIRPKLTITYTHIQTARLGNDDDISNPVIYPNPVVGAATIALPADVANGLIKIEVYNMLGKLCSQTEAYADDDKLIGFDASSLSPGIYILNLQAENTKYTQRMVVK
ncbi:MAG: DNRLRE domain-containing protein [Bacteroidetes bacterium]|jgi:hypothetical protein|nr:DNRLRE domain-containing protein [Bacteroidota bacterium]